MGIDGLDALGTELIWVGKVALVAWRNEVSLKGLEHKRAIVILKVSCFSTTNFIVLPRGERSTSLKGPGILGNVKGIKFVDQHFLAIHGSEKTRGHCNFGRNSNAAIA